MSKLRDVAIEAVIERIAAETSDELLRIGSVSEHRVLAVGYGAEHGAEHDLAYVVIGDGREIIAKALRRLEGFIDRELPSALERFERID